ncbi:MAG: RNA polymerase subunit sigma [Planctomycetes bacterium]|nr:RNA polymerase subunit sigma [Planctomycetota bacterium]
MEHAVPTERTRALFERVARGEAAASAELLGLVYQELHGLAERAMRGDAAHTLQPTALVHEVCLRLLGADEAPQWTSKSHLLSIAAKAMRSVLVDHARRGRAEKRGGAAQRLELDAVEPLVEGHDLELCALDEALQKLAGVDPELAQLVELRFFGGLSIEETARVMNVSEPTIVRGWRDARLFLARELESV